MNCPRCDAPAKTKTLQELGGVCEKCLLDFAAEQDAPRFPDLEIVETIGEGGMGVVYKALQTRLGRTVALKVLSPALASDPSFVGRFSREAKALASLSHPNIVSIHDYGVHDGVPYLVMEYVDGVPLRKLLAAKKLSSERALEVVPQICEALAYAHSKGVVHRDVKPENILVDRQGRVKIADFGLAKLAEPDQTRLSRTNVVMGTPHYMAPEQFENPDQVDHRADIYSLGVVFYEMLTGELPMGRFKAPSEKAAVDRRLDPVVLKSLEREPDDRWQSAFEVKDGITRLQDAPAAAPAADRTRLRVATVMVAGAAALLVSGIALAFSGVQPLGAVMTSAASALGIAGAVMARLARRSAAKARTASNRSTPAAEMKEKGLEEAPTPRRGRPAPPPPHFAKAVSCFVAAAILALLALVLESPWIGFAAGVCAIVGGAHLVRHVYPDRFPPSPRRPGNPWPWLSLFLTAAAATLAFLLPSGGGAAFSWAIVLLLTLVVGAVAAALIGILAAPRVDGRRPGRAMSALILALYLLGAPISMLLMSRVSETQASRARAAAALSISTSRTVLSAMDESVPLEKCIPPGMHAGTLVQLDRAIEEAGLQGIVPATKAVLVQPGSVIVWRNVKGPLPPQRASGGSSESWSSRTGRGWNLRRFDGPNGHIDLYFGHDPFARQAMVQVAQHLGGGAGVQVFSR